MSRFVYDLLEFCIMRMVLGLSLALLLTLFNLGVSDEKASPETLQVAWTVDKGLAMPESVYLDEASGFLFVSNVDGAPAEKDGNGYLSKLSPAGEMIAAKWFTGLNAPKGLRSHQGVLWVSDIDEVVGVNIEDGTLAHRIKIENAQFLNDVAIDAAGTIYVSDMPASKVYQIVDRKVSLFAEGEELESPNGLLVDGNRLLLAAWGYAADFEPKTPGRLLAVDLKTKKITPIVKEPTGNLDGLELDGQGGYTTTDWKAGKVFHVTAQGQVTLIAQHKQGTADHAYLPEQGLLIIPHMLENKLVAYRFKPQK